MIRLIKSLDVAESDFHSAVFRFSDDTFDSIEKEWMKMPPCPPKPEGSPLKLEPRLIKETGTNISSRSLVSLANKESPGIFIAQFSNGVVEVDYT